VVIKRPNLSFEADRDYDKFLRRFKREGQVLAQVQIPNIVRVIEFIEIEGMPCLVMDFVAGETLNECIRRRQSIPENEAWLLFQKLASAVDSLHQQGIIHCDIHPGNIIVQPNGEPMLIDFGSTKLLHPTTWTVTTTVNKEFGPYEQVAESEENTPQPAWDIYSLAANMFFAVTGQKPMLAISRKLYGDGLKSPKELKPELSYRLNHMILQGMALEMKDRPNNIYDFEENPINQFDIMKMNARLNYDFEENPANRLSVRTRKVLTGLFSPNKNRLFSPNKNWQRRAKIEMKQRTRREKFQQQNQPKIARKTNIPTNTDNNSPKPHPEYDFQESAPSKVSLVALFDEESKSSIPQKKPRIYFPWITILILVLGCFFQGVILGDRTGVWAFAGA
jgi:serine/threonine protein kinase